MTTNGAINILELHNPFMGGIEKQNLSQAMDMAIADMKFLDFLVNVIPPNEMEIYREMYKSSSDKNNG